ncbi:GDP-mannose 4,6-dehydratase [soil metagenome]
MRNLSTGAGGFAGQHLVRNLLAQGDTLFGGTFQGALPDGGLLSAKEAARVCWLPLDVTSDGSLAATLERARPDRVFHLAAQSSVGASFADPLATWDANATGTARLLYAVARFSPPGVRVLVVSSAEVYGAVPEAQQPIPEQRALCPINPYAASKAAAEMVALQVAATTDVEVVIARSFTHTGPGQDARFALAGFAQQLASMHEGIMEPVLRVGNLSVRRDYLDVRDAVRAYQRLLDVGENGTVYNVCSGEAHDLGDLVQTLVAMSGTGARIEVDPDRFRPADIPLLCGNPERTQALGWSAAIPMQQTLSDLLACNQKAGPRLP